MTKNILDAISIDEDLTPKSSFVIEKKIEKKEKKFNEFPIKLPGDKKKKRKKEEEKEIDIRPAAEPLWLSVSEASKTGGVEQKTIRRAIQSETIKFKIIKDRYYLEFASLVKYLSSNKKLKNKFLSHGIGQYVDRWK